MKKILLLILITLTFASCSRLRNRELYAITDDYVENIYYYSSRGSILDSGPEKYTEDKSIRVQSIGKLIIVKLEYVAEDSEYETLKEELADHYSNHPRVRRVYINQGGTIVIDCRN